VKEYGRYGTSLARRAGRMKESGGRECGREATGGRTTVRGCDSQVDSCIVLGISRSGFS